MNGGSSAFSFGHLACIALSHCSMPMNPACGSNVSAGHINELDKGHSKPKYAARNHKKQATDSLEEQLTVLDTLFQPASSDYIHTL